MFDIYLMFGFGLLGYIMRKAHFPLGPMILGVILGKMVDENLRRAILFFHGESMKHIFSRPVGLVLVVIVIVTFISGVYSKKVKEN